MAVVLVLSLAAAFCNATSSIMQKLGAQSTPPGDSLRLRLMADLVRHPAWLAGMGALIASFFLQAAALGHGRLATVQPVLASELLFVLGILVVWFHRQVGFQEWTGAAGIVLGVGGFLVVASPSGGRATAPPLAWLLTGGLAVGVIAALLVLGQVLSGSRRAALFGAAGAVAFALTAALVKSSVGALLDHGVAALFVSWRTYAVGVAGAGAVFLTGNAFQCGSVAAAQAALSGVDPLVSIGIGVGLFHEHLRAGPGALALEALALAIMVAGVVLLSHSPLVTQAGDGPEVG